MRNDEREIVARVSVALEELRGKLAHPAHGVLEHVLPFLMHVVHALFDRFMRGRVERAAARHVQIAAARAVNVVRKVDDAVGVGVAWLEQDGARAIAKQNACGAILEIENRSHHIRADDQDFLVRARMHELGADRQRVCETGACGRKVESPCVLRAEAILNEARGGGKQHVRRDGGNDNELDFLRIHTVRFQEFSGSFGAEMR